MPTTISLAVKLYAQVTIPSNIKLLSIEENEKANEGTPGAWYFRWGNLYYNDEHGVEQEYVCDLNFDNCEAYKRPEVVDMEEESESKEKAD